MRYKKYKRRKKRLKSNQCLECKREIFREEVEDNLQCGYHQICSDCLPKKPRKHLISLPDFEIFRKR